MSASEAGHLVKWGDLTRVLSRSFGMMSIAMSLIPLFGPALMFTTAAGAALWAAELERTGNSEPGQQGEVGGKDLVEEVHPGQIDYD